MKKLLFFSLPIILNCMSSVHQFNQSDPMSFQDYQSAKKITADAEQFAILGFVYDTNYVEEAIKKLHDSCPDGSIEQIGTTFKTKLGFMSWTNQIHLVGYCRGKK